MVFQHVSGIRTVLYVLYCSFLHIRLYLDITSFCSIFALPPDISRFLLYFLVLTLMIHFCFDIL